MSDSHIDHLRLPYFHKTETKCAQNGAISMI